jgi:DNA polymerase III delta prime subunit
MNYASSMSLVAEGRKYVILDEADHLNPNTVQPALRNFMEEFSSNCGFILTCNYKSKIIEPLHSRCAVIDFSIKGKDKVDLASQFYKRVTEILNAEGVDFDTTAVAVLVKKFFPDMRRILNELQAYSAIGKIDSGILDNLVENNIKELIGFMKKKNFTAVRKWVSDNADLDSSDLYTTLYDMSSQVINPKTLPLLVLILAKYQYQDSFAMNKQINTAACLGEIMSSCVFL